MSPGAGSARQDDAKIRKIVKAHGGKVLFIGHEESGKCFVLLNMAKVKDPKKLRKALNAATGESVVLKTPAESERKPRKKKT